MIGKSSYPRNTAKSSNSLLSLVLKKTVHVSSGQILIFHEIMWATVLFLSIKGKETYSYSNALI